MVFCRRGPRRSILKSLNERRSCELRTMRRRVKRSSIVINNSDPTGESRSGYRERLVKQIRYIILLNERGSRRVTILGSERVENDLCSMGAEVRKIRVSSTIHKTCSKLTRDFSLVYCTSRQKLHSLAFAISRGKSRNNNLDLIILLYSYSGI